MFTNFNIGAWTDDSVTRHWSLAYTDFYIEPYNNTPIDKLIIYLSNTPINVHCSQAQIDR